MGMILRIASSRIVGQGDIVGRSGYFSLNLSANSVMRGRLDARRTLKSLVADLRFDTNVKVEVDFEKVILQDNEEDGTLTGEVKFILYKGDHYHLTVLSDWDENVFVDTNDVWDDGDRVGITIPPDAIRIVKITD